MDLLFLNKNLELVGIIDTAKSIQWRERYYEVGTFEVYVQVNPDVLAIVNNSYFIAREDSTYVGVIEDIENEDDINNGNYLIIQGRMAESLIGRRIIRNITYLTSNLFNACNNFLQANILNPVDTNRKMTCLNTTVVNDLATNPTIEIQATFENNLLDFISTLLTIYNSNIKLVLNNNNFDIHLYSGTDRSYGQNTNPYVVFSKEYDNLISSNYKFGSQKELNALYVGGEDNETATEGRFIDKYELPFGSGVVSDIDRKEAFINASDLKQNWKDEQEVEHALTTPEYRRLLQDRGKENIVEPSEELNANIDLSTYVYNQDYYLGDIITIYNETMGMYTNKRIVGMDIVDDEKGQTLEPTFDKNKEE